MTTPQLSPRQDGIGPSVSIVERHLSLRAQARSELRSAVAACVANAVAKGYSLGELAAQYLHGPEKFYRAADEALPITLERAVAMATVCGYRLHITMEPLDRNEIVTPPEHIKTPFEASVALLVNSATMTVDQTTAEELVRALITCYFSQMNEKGYYMTLRQ